MHRSVNSNNPTDISAVRISARDFFYISNILSLVRIGLIPLIVFSIIRHYYLMTLVTGGLAILSDMLDGYFARRLNQQSDLGKILDPVADKLVIGVVVLALILSNPKFPLWAFAIVITRDLLIVFGNIVLFRRKRIVTKSNRWGKGTSFVLSTALMLYVFNDYFDNYIPDSIPFYVLSIGLVLALISAWTYGKRWLYLMQISNSPQPVETINPNKSPSS
jgi:CDP-diacylglycerol--glycerol-3-phosphate 3-phosphatidyltransferase